MLSEYLHNPVMVKELLQGLQIAPGVKVIDATVGEGGHTLAMLEHTRGRIKILAIDRDREILRVAKKRIREAGYWSQVIFVHGRFSEIERIAKRKNFLEVEAILADLGISMWHYKKSKRGFSFAEETLLDMRYDLKDPVTALEIVNLYPPQEIEKILREFGEEKEASKITKDIIRHRQEAPILTAKELAEIVEKVKKERRKRTHPATKVFMALRIAVNKELEELEGFLQHSWALLKEGGRIGVITFHSLEEKIVKREWQRLAKEGKIKILTKKGLRPNYTEIKNNLAARSAKLWLAQKL